MERNAQALPHDSVMFRVPGGDRRRHSLVIVTGAETGIEELESNLATATRRGLDKVAKLVRQRIAECNEQMLENALAAIDRDFAPAGALVQLAVVDGILRCRAFVEPEREDELIGALGRIPGVRRIAVEIVLPFEVA